MGQVRSIRPRSNQSYGSLLRGVEADDRAVQYADWRPPELPDLQAWGVKDVQFDYETTGLKWWDPNVRAIGFSLCVNGVTGYFPYRHQGFEHQIPEEQAIRWQREQLRNLHITNAHTKFEVHIAQNDGVSLEDQGCTVGDVQLYAALLNDHRRRFSQEVLVAEYLTDEQKVTHVNGERLDTSRMAEYPPGMVAVRGEADVRQVWKLHNVMVEQMREQNLERVWTLEDSCIYATTEMERNGLFVNVEKLNRWVTEVTRLYEQTLWEIRRGTGIDFNPDQNESWVRLFERQKVPIAARTKPSQAHPEGQASFTDEALASVTNPWVQQGRLARKLSSLLSKYLVKYQRTVEPNGRLRFALHQLRGEDEEGRQAGTISGRYSGSAIKIGSEKFGINPQQIYALESQQDDYGKDFPYIIRELFEPEDKERHQVISADAEQIEYRIFADLANNPRVIEAYRPDWENLKNPRDDYENLSFHKTVWAMLKPFKPNLLYKPLKNMNFMVIYGGGDVKLAWMLGTITPADYAELEVMDYKQRRQDPRMKEAYEVKAIYDHVLPEVRPLLAEAAHLARPSEACDERCIEWDRYNLHGRLPHRGYVRDLIGRRTRFEGAYRLHKALNGVIQGGAASIMKQKNVEVHRARKRLGVIPRVTIHDQWVGDGTTEAARELKKLLDVQSFPQQKVPIVWAVKARANWRLCDEKEETA